MIETLERVVLEMTTEVKDVKSALQEVVSELRKTKKESKESGDSVAGMLGRVKEMAAGTFAGLATWGTVTKVGREALEFAQESVQEFLEAEKVQRKLTAAVRAQGFELPGVIQYYDQLAEKYQAISVHGDDSIKGIQTLLVEVGRVLPSEMDKALDATTNLAAGLTIELEPAAMMVAKAFEGDFGALKKAGVQIDETRAKAEGMTYVLDQISARFSGQRQAEVSSYAGQLKQLANEWDNYKEEIGKAIVESGLAEGTFIVLKAGLAELNREFTIFRGIAGAVAAIAKHLPGGIGTGFEMLTARMKAEIAALREETKKFAAERAKQLEDERKQLEASLKAQEEEAKRKRQKELDDAKSAAEAAARAKRVEQLTKELSGQALRDSLAELAAAVAKVNKEHGIALEQYPRLIQEVEKYRRAGLPIPALLEQIVKGTDEITFMPWAVQMEIANAKVNVGGQMWQEYLKSVQDVKLEVEEFGGVIRELDFTPGSTQSLFAAGDWNWSRGLMAPPPPKVKAEMKNLVLVAGALADNLREVAQELEGGKREAIEFAAEVIRLFEMIQAGAQTAQLAIAGVTMVFGLVLNQLAQDAAITAQLNERIRELRAELRALNQDVPEQLGQSLTAYILQLEHALRVTEHWRDKLSDGLNELGGMFERFGGQIPVQLKPMIDAMLQSGALTAEQKELLESLATGPSWETIQEAAARWQLSTDALGAGFEQLKSNDFFDQALADWKMFAGINADMNQVVAAMAPQINEQLAIAQKYGIKVPEYMRPILEAMAAGGQLAMDLGSIEFDPTIQSSLQKATDAILELIVALKALGGTGLDPFIPLAPGQGPRGRLHPRSAYRSGKDSDFDKMYMESVVGLKFAADDAARSLRRLGSAMPVPPSYVGSQTMTDAAVGRPIEVTLVADGRQLARIVTIHQPDEARSLRYR